LFVITNSEQQESYLATIKLAVMNYLTLVLKSLLVILLLLCLLQMPYSYYQLVRFAALVGFALLAVDAFQYKRLVEATLFICLALLFQPFVKVVLDKEIWNLVDIVVIVGLLISITIGLVKRFSIKKEVEMQHKKRIQKIIAKEFLILLGIAVLVGLAFIIGVAGQNIVQAQTEKLNYLKDSLETSKDPFSEFGGAEIIITTEDELPPPPKKGKGGNFIADETDFIPPNDGIVVKKDNELASPLKKGVITDEYGIPIREKQKDDSWEEKGNRIPPPPSGEIVMPLSPNSEKKKSWTPPSEDLTFETDSISNKSSFLSDEIVDLDSLNNATKMKIQIINTDINSKVELLHILKSLWLSVLIILGIIVYPIRFLILLTLWAIKTVRT